MVAHGKGTRYFNCEAGFGLFVRPNQLDYIVGDPVEGDASPWESFGAEMLEKHKKHIDAMLSQVREEMELLANFETYQGRMTEERAQTYSEAVRISLSHCNDLNKSFSSTLKTIHSKHSISMK